MGLKENLNNNWKDSVIEYQGRKLYVVEQLELNNDLYIYVFIINKLPDLEINFLKKEKDSIFSVVTDMDLFNELLGNVGIKLATKEVEKVLKEKMKEKNS